MANFEQSSLGIWNFGSNLKRLRSEKGLTHESFAELAGISSRLVYDYEDGNKYPRLDTACRIAMVLGVSLDSMLRK